MLDIKLIRENPQIVKNNSVIFHSPVPYIEVNNVIHQNDIVVFVESLRDRYKNVARLSFSTKITDYLASGKCIFAVGPSDCAPIEYFLENDSAIVACNYDEIKSQLYGMLRPGKIETYSHKAFSCGKKHHDKSVINETLYGKLADLSNCDN